MANHSFCWNFRLGFLLLALAFVFSAWLLGCGPPSPPPVVISFSDTPVPIATIAPVAPLTNRLKRPTITRRRTPTAAPGSLLPRSFVTSLATAVPVLPSSTDSRTSLPTEAVESAVLATQVLPSAQGTSPGQTSPVIAVAPSPSSLPPTVVALPLTPLTAEVSVEVTPGGGASDVVANEVGPSTTTVPEITVEPTQTLTPILSSPTPFPTSAGSTAIAVTPTTSSGPFPGQVSEDQGLVVTTASKRSKYYYLRSDTGWHRIHSANRVWFMSVDDLLRAFPGRALHPARVPKTATPRKATATPVS